MNDDELTLTLLRKIETLENRIEYLEAVEKNFFSKIITGSNYFIRRSFAKGVADNVTTGIFRITTTNETGSTDGGAYSVLVYGLITHAATNNSQYVASKSYLGHFSRSVEYTGTGVNSAISEISETASAATSAANRDIGTVTMSVSENSEYELDVEFTVDTTGTYATTGAVSLLVDLVWRGFLTTPTMTAL